MLVSLFGRPGSGKTSVGDWLATTYDFYHLPLGRLLKDPANVDAMGIRPALVAEAIASGRTIDDDRLFDWLDREIENSARPVVVDGYPRVPAGVAFFNRLAERLPATRIVALHLCCSPDTSLIRTMHRARDDDKPGLLAARLDEFQSVQLPLLGRLSRRVETYGLDAEQPLAVLLTDLAALVSLDRLGAS